MNWKKIGKTLLFPPMAILLILLPLAALWLWYSLAVQPSETAGTYLSYVLATYTLTVWCLQMPKFVGFCKTVRFHNRYAKRWLEDDRLRVTVTLFGSLLWNVAYAMLQLWLALTRHIVWFYALSGYYISLALMRFFLVRHTMMHRAGENQREELLKYRACGWIFLLMNLALSTMIFCMVHWNQTFEHGPITAIMMATYTFTSFSFALVNLIRYKKYNSPIYSAAKAISLAASAVSVLTLESTMLTTFGGESAMDAVTQKRFLGISGGAVTVWIVAMAVYMIVQSTRKLNLMKKEGK